MIKIEKVNVSGWEVAIRGLRNSYDSWDKSDSTFTPAPIIGQNDISLMERLAKSGDSHAKFLRYIIVTFDITAPRYWWAEMDTYKVGTVRNSCSTMHTVAKKAFARNDFSCEHLHDNALSTLDTLIAELNAIRDRYNAMDAHDAARKSEWYSLIQLLPASYNQKATLLVNYQVLRHIYIDRQSHKLDEWQDFCKWITSLPYADKLLTYPQNSAK